MLGGKERTEREGRIRPKNCEVDGKNLTKINSFFCRHYLQNDLPEHSPSAIVIIKGL